MNFRAGVTELVVTHGDRQKRAELNHELGSIQRSMRRRSANDQFRRRKGPSFAVHGSRQGRGCTSKGARLRICPSCRQQVLASENAGRQSLVHGGEAGRSDRRRSGDAPSRESLLLPLDGRLFPTGSGQELVCRSRTQSRVDQACRPQSARRRSVRGCLRPPIPKGPRRGCRNPILGGDEASGRNALHQGEIERRHSCARDRADEIRRARDNSKRRIRTVRFCSAQATKGIARD